MKNGTLIEAKDVITRFGRHTIHDGVSFSIAKGEIFVAVEKRPCFGR